MNINFHYATIKVLAHQAGFSLPDSQLIAYASQYVDDAVAHNEMKLNEDPGIPDIRYKDMIFDPICTAHKDLDYAKGVINRKSRKLVYVCFHFIPSLMGATDISRRKVVKDGKPAREQVIDALNAWNENKKAREEKRRALIAVGVALHSYADTWSHQGFSGFWDSDNNDISNLETGPRGQSTLCKIASKFISYAAPDIGHAELGKLPDRSDIVWRCKPPKRTPEGESNCEEFLEASRTILDLLSNTTKKGKPWNDIKAKLRNCFMNPWDGDGFKPSDRSEWRTQFPKLHFDYDPRSWFEAALKPSGRFFDILGSMTGLDPEDYELCEGREYVYFHAAAGKQREEISKKIDGLHE